jgi:hypothetical protein
MPDYCTCGTTLVDNARFCHRCGRPTSEQDLQEAREVPPPPPLPRDAASLLEAGLLEAKQHRAQLGQLPVNFANPIALRVAFAMSCGILMVQMIPFLGFLCVLWWLAAGWGGVVLYRRLTGFSLSIPAGARLGSITGVLTFVGMAIVFALTMAFMGKQVLDQMVQQDPQMKEVVNNPMLLGVVFLMVLAIIFGLVVGVCAAGGALGAKFTARRANT